MMKVKIFNAIKVSFLSFFLLSAGFLSCNSPENREQEAEQVHEEEEMVHDEEMHDEEMMRDRGHMMNDSVHMDSIRDTSMIRQER